MYYNFPLYVEPPTPTPKAEGQGTPKQPMSPAASGPLPEQAPSATSFTQLCLLVDVTASKLKRIGRYNMGRIIGKGAFGTVRLAMSTQTGIVSVLAPLRCTCALSVPALSHHASDVPVTAANLLHTAAMLAVLPREASFVC